MIVNFSFLCFITFDKIKLDKIHRKIQNIYIPINTKLCNLSETKIDTNKTNTGNFALQLIKGSIIIVSIFSFLFSILLVAKIAGIVHQNHIKSDKNQFPDNHIFFKDLSKI